MQLAIDAVHLVDGKPLYVRKRPDAPTRYTAHEVVHGEVVGPPVATVQSMALHRNRVIYLEQPGYPHPRGALWVDHRLFRRFGSGDGMQLRIEGDHLRITRWGNLDELIPIRAIDAFLGIAPLCPYR